MECKKSNGKKDASITNTIKQAVHDENLTTDDTIMLNKITCIFKH